MPARKELDSFYSRLVQRLPEAPRRILEPLGQEDVMLLSAGLGFYALVSIAPLVILVLWLTSLFLGDAEINTLSERVARVAPRSLGIDSALKRVAELGNKLGFWAVATGVWPATAYGAGLVRAFDRLRKHRSKPKGMRGRGLLLGLLLPIFVVGTLGGAYAGLRVLGAEGSVRILGVGIGLITAFAASVGTVSLIYRFFPRHEMEWRPAIKGAVTACVGISLISVLFMAYLAVGANFKDHYVTSGLAGVVLLAVWLFLANALILVGYQTALEDSR